MARPMNTQFAVAVHVLTYLASTAAVGPVSSDVLSASTNTNPVYVRRVLGPLRTAGLVNSRSGVHGGWELAVDAREVTLAQVWGLLQGDDPVIGLHGPDPDCPVGHGVQASLQFIDRAIFDAVAAELEHHTIDNVLTSGAPQFTMSPSTQSTREGIARSS